MRILMIGAARSGEMLSSILIQNNPGYNIIFLDDNESMWGKEVCDRFLVLKSPVRDFLDSNEISFYDMAFISIGIHKLMSIREELYNLVKEKMPLVNIIHPTAHVSKDAVIGEGNYIGAFSYIGPYCEIGDCNYFSANTILEHHTKVGDLNSWGPFNSTSGGCEIGDRVCMGTKIGMLYNVRVGSGCSVAAGVTLFKSIGDNSIVRNVNFPDHSVSEDRRSRRQRK